MDAVSFLDVAPPARLLSRSFADAAAIARALHFSLSDAPEPPVATAATDLGARAAATASPPAVAFMHGAGTHPPTGCAAPASSPSPSSSSARCRLGPAGGRAGKRRPRPSKRAPTTYISTDAATFRLMVQRVTGADDEADQLHQHDVSAGLGLGLLLPHFGVGPLLPPDPPAAHDVAAAYTATLASTVGAAPAAEQPLFPTLDSWNVMYGKNEVV